MKTLLVVLLASYSLSIYGAGIVSGTISANPNGGGTNGGGSVSFATPAQTATGTSTTLAVTPYGLAQSGVLNSGGYSNNTYTTSSQTVADNYVKNLVGTLTNYVLTTNTLAALAQPLPVNISGSAATANTLTSLASPPPTPSLIVCWGDSLTGAYDCASQAYGNYLSGLLNIPVNIQSFPGASSSIILSNFLAAPNLWGYPTIIWSGRNDFTTSNTVLGDIATMVSDLNSVGNSNYLVMSIINMENEYSGSTNPTSGYYFTITNLNHYLSATYPNNFFDVREYLVNAANTNLPQDLWTFTNDIPADSLRCSPGDVHLNNAGYFTVANGILQTSFLNLNIYVFSEGKTRSLIGQALAVPPIIGGITPNSINATSINATNINATNINASTAITVGGIYYSTLSPGELVLSASNFTNAVMIQSQLRGVSGNGYPVDLWYCNGNYGLYLNRYYTTGNMSWGFGMTNNAISYPNTLWMYGTGFVGIGTNAPSQQLEVNGSALIDGTITATNFVGNGSGMSNITSLSTVTGIHYVSSLTFSNILTGYMLGTNALNQPVMWAVSTNIITY